MININNYNRVNAMHGYHTRRGLWDLSSSHYNNLLLPHHISSASPASAMNINTSPSPLPSLPFLDSSLKLGLPNDHGFSFLGINTPNWHHGSTNTTHVGGDDEDNKSNVQKGPHPHQLMKNKTIIKGQWTLEEDRYMLCIIVAIFSCSRISKLFILFVC